jgi:hypothetical protein
MQCPDETWRHRPPNSVASRSADADGSGFPAHSNSWGVTCVRRSSDVPRSPGPWVDDALIEQHAAGLGPHPSLEQLFFSLLPYGYPNRHSKFLGQIQVDVVEVTLLVPSRGQRSPRLNRPFRILLSERKA